MADVFRNLMPYMLTRFILASNLHCKWPSALSALQWGKRLTTTGSDEPLLRAKLPGSTGIQVGPSQDRSWSIGGASKPMNANSTMHRTPNGYPETEL